MPREDREPRHFAWFAGILSLGVGAALFLKSYEPLGGFVFAIAGVIMIVAGLGMMIWSLPAAPDGS